MDLFETTEINGMLLTNRFVRSATFEGMAADDGAATPGLIKLMIDLAQGGVGLINRWQTGDLAGSACLSDNKCFGPIMAGKGLYCVMDQKDRQSS